MSETERMNDQQLCLQVDNVKNSTIGLPSKKNTLKNDTSSKQITETKTSKNKQNIMEQNNFIKNCEKAINGKRSIKKLLKNKKVTLDNATATSKSPTSKCDNGGKTSNDKFNESVKTRNMADHKNENEKSIEK